MPTPNAPGVFRVAVEGTSLGDDWVNVFHFTGPTPPTTTEITIAFNALESFYNAMKGNLTNQWRVNRMVATTYQGVAAYQEERIPSTAIVGASTASPLPPDVAVCITWRTARIGRSYRGRTYLAGWTQSALTATGQLISGHRTNLATAITALSGLLQIDLAVYSRVNNTAEDVTRYAIDDQFDTQRRRGEKQVRTKTEGVVAEA